MSDSQTRSSIAILALCPNIEVLIQPQHPPLSNPFLEFNALSPQLPSLKRLEWWNYGAGFNTLLSVLSAAPNLEYLFLGLPGFALVNSIPAHTPDIHLPSLRTLRLSILLTPASEYLTRAISKWSLPSLDTLVSDLPLGLNKVWTSHGSRLRVVELEEYDIPCLQGCPALRELNCSLPTSPLRGESTSYTSVTTIQYHAASKSLTPGYLEQHFFPCSCGFPISNASGFTGHLPPYSWMDSSRQSFNASATRGYILSRLLTKTASWFLCIGRSLDLSRFFNYIHALFIVPVINLWWFVALKFCRLSFRLSVTSDPEPVLTLVRDTVD